MRWLELLILLVLFVAIEGLTNPYEVLGVHRTAGIQDIRKSYKKLAKEWHPDKNSDPLAEKKFVEITQAYELLSDPERRKQYDNHGITEDAPAFRQKADYSQFGRFDPFDELFDGLFNFGSGFRSRFQDRDITVFHRLSITSRAYEKTLVPKSHHSPYLILFYSDWCFACLQLEPVWRRVMEELEPIGVGVATVHAENEQLLTRKIGVQGLPYLILLMDGKPYHYKESLFSIPKIVEFIRTKLPYRLVQSITAENVDMFLNGWEDNRIRALLFERQENIRLRYLLTSFHFRERVAFGYIHLGISESQSLQERFNIASNMDTLLLFNENTDRPTASLSMGDIPVKTMHDIINRNKYLLLPRLSSQEMFDALCPPESARLRKRLCVVLVCQNTPTHDKARKLLREFAQESLHNTERVRFTYIFAERQTEFVSSLTTEQNSPAEPMLHVVILWRRGPTNLQYEWLPSSWGISDEENNKTRAQLESALHRLLHDHDAFNYEAVVKELIDEHAQGIISRIINRLIMMADYARENMTREQILPLASVIITVLFVIGGGYIMSYLVRLEEESVRSKCKDNVKSPGSSKAPAPQLKLHELRCETYNGLIRLLKPGCRTLILLVDAQSAKTLISKFHKTVWPYRKNKTLMFGYMYLEKYLDWYKQLLVLSLPEPRELNINPRNCIGTVLSLNGHRKYFCMYHAKHPECTKGKKTGTNSKHGAGAFMGFESSESEETETSDVEMGPKKGEDKEPLVNNRYAGVLFEESLLDGLSNWLDRLFEGTTHRYHINYWPEMQPK